MEFQKASREAWSRGNAVLYRSNAVFERQLVRFIQNNQGVSSTAAGQSIDSGYIPHLITNANAHLRDAGLFIESEPVRVPQGQRPFERLYLRQLSPVDLELVA